MRVKNKNRIKILKLIIMLLLNNVIFRVPQINTKKEKR